MKLSHFTVHGFRSTFRDWVGEATDFPGEVAEMSLRTSSAVTLSGRIAEATCLTDVQR